MDVQQIIKHIVRTIQSTNAAFSAKGLPYDPQIIARATFKELRSTDPTITEAQFDQAIEKLHDDGLAVTKANGLVFFSESVLGAELAEA